MTLSEWLRWIMFVCILANMGLGAFNFALMRRYLRLNFLLHHICMMAFMERFVLPIWGPWAAARDLDIVISTQSKRHP